MLTVTWKDGARYTGETADDIVEQMREVDAAWNGPKTTAEYREAVARRTKEVYGRSIRHDTALHLLEDLRNLGEVRIEDGP